MSGVKKTIKRHCFLQGLKRLWQNRRLHRPFSSFGLHQSTTLRKWCSGASQKQALAPPGPETAIEGSYAAGAVLHRLRCTGYAAGAMLQERCCKDYAAGTMLQAQMLQGLPCRLRCSGFAALGILRVLCCTGTAARAALAIQISMPQVLHWPHRTACSNCCTGNKHHHAPTAALATRISMLDMTSCTAAPLFKSGRRTTR